MTVGETHTPQVTFSDADGVNYNPTTTFIRVLSPTGALTSPAVTNPSVGVFRSTFTLTVRGVWRYWFHGEGPSGAIVVEGESVCAVEAY